MRLSPAGHHETKSWPDPGPNPGLGAKTLYFTSFYKNKADVELFFNFTIKHSHQMFLTDKMVLESPTSFGSQQANYYVTFRNEM
jgi:hypothetical protein